MRHDPDHVPALVADPRDVVRRAVRVIQVAQHDAVFVFQLRERRGVREVVTLVMGDRERELLTGLAAAVQGGPCRLHPHADASQTKRMSVLRSSAPGRRCASVRTWKPLQTPRMGPPDAGELFERAHDVREAGDGAGTQVVAVGEAAGHDHGVRTLQVRVGVPELDRLGTHPLDGVQGVAVAVGAGEDGYPYLSMPLPTSHSYSSMVGLDEQTAAHRVDLVRALDLHLYEPTHVYGAHTLEPQSRKRAAHRLALRDRGFQTSDGRGRGPSRLQTSGLRLQVLRLIWV